jgi:hypothetical protein
MGLLAGGLILTVCFLVALPAVRQARTANAIRETLSADVTLARKISRNRALRDCDSRTIQAYARGLRRIDMSRCPREFELAYLDHIDAWESFAESRDSSSLPGFLAETVMTNSIPLLSLLSILKEKQDTDRIEDEITATWNEIERLALSYGVRVPE